MSSGQAPPKAPVLLGPIYGASSDEESFLPPVAEGKRGGGKGSTPDLSSALVGGPEGCEEPSLEYDGPSQEPGGSGQVADAKAALRRRVRGGAWVDGREERDAKGGQLLSGGRDLLPW